MIMDIQLIGAGVMLIITAWYLIKAHTRIDELEREIKRLTK